MPKRIPVVDDNAPIRGLVREFIEARPGFEICGEATDGAEGIQKGRELKPDLIVLDFFDASHKWLTGSLDTSRNRAKHADHFIHFL